jgi:uncharacterized protein (TIGR00251 family)
MHTDIKIRLIPRSSRNEVLGREADGYRVKVTSPPVEGMANQALIALLADELGIPKRDIEITAGKTSRMKTVRLHGLSEADIEKALQANSVEHGAKRQKRLPPT